ncbi:hypothetical protein HNY73_003363 [Argiope bruennichi]|uniref:Uncharacterized protein n=1 Tax=Argiope bruennichi TaxID=94029 RepID=A0A8T0FN86_ARGBR|nr:hypothetical protein HNY73_003363 [Argiope bruennichi]
MSPMTWLINTRCENTFENVRKLRSSYLLSHTVPIAPEHFAREQGKLPRRGEESLHNGSETPSEKTEASSSLFTIPSVGKHAKNFSTLTSGKKPAPGRFTAMLFQNCNDLYRKYLYSFIALIALA